ncbi:hypothetical protein [Streptomyces sp. NBC_01669]|uniref:hypothetical protein n=1 Tax=Streptomyces sp. NBC_01669 TaxID=2975909 RepID=UPI00225568B1|nr:hypothetical protein [Streptomyces sp. NBC_01669]MCX4538994.1 hypothetical protein [Streptomyces sp. NBC_01669]
MPALELADQLALAARRLAGALVAGQPADDFDLGVVARIPTVLAARAHRAAPAAQALHGTLVRRAAETSTGIDLAARTPTARQNQPTTGHSSAPGNGTQASRDDSKRDTPAAQPTARTAQASRDDSGLTVEPKGIEPRPQKLAMKKARAIAGAAEPVRHPEHRDNHRWILRSGDTVIGYVEPSYGGTSRSGRNGWTGRLGGSLGPRCKSRDGAALDPAARWIRLVTTEPSRTLTGDH